jgi:hypothetical protein
MYKAILQLPMFVLGVEFSPNFDLKNMMAQIWQNLNKKI